MSLANKTAIATKIAWAQQILIKQGYAPLEPPHMLRSVPWSTVWCFSTVRGNVYLKAMAQDFAYEPALLSFLANEKLDNLPVIIATCPDNHCFLMEDAGASLKSVLEAHFDVAIVKRLLASYAQLQRKCIPLVDELLELGLRDLSPRSLPAAFAALLADSDLGFAPRDIKNLRESPTAHRALCTELHDIGIPPSLEHGDFDDDNIMIKDGNITFLDFGDATVAHPFLSLAAFLNHVQQHHRLDPSSDPYLAIRDAYLHEWEDYAPHDQLVHALELANKLMTFVWMFGLKRIQSCPGISAAEYVTYVDKVVQHWPSLFPISISRGSLS